jgi:hypothetical protein
MPTGLASLAISWMISCISSLAFIAGLRMV